MIISKTPLLLAHLLGLCLAMGPVMLLDARLSRLLFGAPVDRLDVDLALLLKPWIRVGLGLLWISGGGFLLVYALGAPEALTNPKLHAKLVVVAVLTVNGALVERYAFAQLKARVGRLLLDPDDGRQRLRLLAVGSVSATSWCTPALLGTVRELNFACAAWVFLLAYAAATIAAFGLLAAVTSRARSVAGRRVDAPPADEALGAPIAETAPGGDEADELDRAARTNLLALGGAIAAARAGEAGCGFAAPAAALAELAALTALAADAIGRDRARADRAAEAVGAITGRLREIAAPPIAAADGRPPSHARAGRR